MVSPAGRWSYTSPTGGLSGGRATASRTRTEKPTQQEIRGWVAAIGGDMTSLSYTLPTQGAASEGAKPQRINVVQFAGLWGQFWQQVGIDLRYHMLELEDDVRGETNNKALPDNWQIRIPPTGPNAAQRFRDQIFTGDPQFKVEFPTLRDSGRRSLLEQQWTAYIMNEIQRQEQASQQSPLDVFKQHTVDYGAGSWYDVLDLTRWPDRPKMRGRGKKARDEFNQAMTDYEAERRQISPFVVRNVHPLNFAYDMSTNPPQWAMIREPVFRWDAEREYPNWHTNEERTIPAPGAQPIVRVEWWTPDWHAVYLNGEPALGPEDGADEDGVAPNPYGHVPIVFAAGSRGEGDVIDRPEVVHQGLFRKIRNLLLEDALIFNLRGIYERRMSFGPKLAIIGPESDIDGARGDALEEELMAGPQRVARIPNSWDIREINPAQIPAEIVAREQAIREQIEQATAYDVAAGANQTGPAYKMQLQLSQTQKRVALDVLHLQQALEAWAVNRLRAVKKLLGETGEKVGANLSTKGAAEAWVDLDPNSIPDTIKVTCNLTSDSDTEKARKEQAGLALMDKNLLSPEDFWRDYMDDPDPEQRIAGWVDWQMFLQVTMPALMQVAQQGLLPVLAQTASQAGQMVAVSQDGGLTWTPVPAPVPTGGVPPAPGGGVGAPAALPAAPSGPQRGQSPPLSVGPQGAMLPGEQQAPQLAAFNNAPPLQPLPPIASPQMNGVGV